MEGNFALLLEDIHNSATIPEAVTMWLLSNKLRPIKRKSSVKAI